MARPRKTGLQYFNLDCQLDTKVEMLQVAHGNDGFAVWIKLLQEIYQTENGVLDISDILRRKTLAKRANISAELWDEVVNTCVDVGLFDPEAYARHELSSNGIRKRLEKVAEERDRSRQRALKSSAAQNHRKTGEREREIESVGGEGEKRTDGAQSPPPEPAAPIPKSSDRRPGSAEEVIALFRERNYLNPDEEGQAMWDHYDANGWVMGRAKAPIRNWRSAAANWNRNAKKYARERNGNGHASYGVTADQVLQNLNNDNPDEW